MEMKHKSDQTEAHKDAHKIDQQASFTVIRHKTRAWAQVAALLLALMFMSAIPAAAQDVPAADTPAAAANKLFIPSINNNACLGRNDPDMPIGVQMYGDTGPSSPFYSAMRESQASWLRVAIEWREVQPLQGVYNWGWADKTVAAAATGCMNIVLTLEGTASWAATSGSRSPIKQTLLNEYANYVQAVVERYDGDGIADAPNGAVVEYFEFYNEPDFVTFDGTSYGWGDNGARYAEMLKAVYPKVKDANPNAQVVLGGIAYEWFIEQNGPFDREFLDNILANDGGDYFDVMNLHCYPFPNNCRSWANGESTGLIEKIEDVRAKMDEYELDKPLIITEVGWHSDDNDRYSSTDDLQGRYLVQLMTQAQVYDVDVIIWWTLVNPQPIAPGDPGYPYDTGLFTNAPTVKAKPSFKVFDEYRRRMGYAQYVSTNSGVADNDELESYRFRDPETKKLFYVAWTNSVEGNDSTTMTAVGKKATVFNKQGVQISVKLDADDGTTDNRVRIQVGSDPIYIVMD